MDKENKDSDKVERRRSDRHDKENQDSGRRKEHSKNEVSVQPYSIN